MTDALAPMVGMVVGPGDAVLRLPDQGEVRIGSGLRPHDGHITAQKCGVVRQTRAGKLWLEGRQKRYTPAEEDHVVGVIVERHPENFTVNIGAPLAAHLPQLSFEGATRRNRPNLRVGDAVYARVVAANRDAESTLSCTDALGRASEFGHLKGGTLFGVTTSYARHLLSKPPAPVLVALGQQLQFEMAVGINGRVWVDSSASATTVHVCSAVRRAERVPAAQVAGLVQIVLSGEGEGASGAAGMDVS